MSRFRRRWLTPVPEFASLAKLNDYIAACDVRYDAPEIGHKPAMVAAKFAEEHLIAGHRAAR